MEQAKHGGAPSPKSQRLRRTIKKAINDNWTDWAIIHEIMTSDCTDAEKQQFLQEIGLKGVYHAGMR